VQHKSQRLKIFYPIFEFSRLSESLGTGPGDDRGGTLTVRQPCQLNSVTSEAAAERATIQPRDIAETADTKPLQHQLDLISLSVRVQLEQVERQPIEEFPFPSGGDYPGPATSRRQMSNLLIRANSSSRFESNPARAPD